MYLYTPLVSEGLSGYNTLLHTPHTLSQLPVFPPFPFGALSCPLSLPNSPSCAPSSPLNCLCSPKQTQAADRCVSGVSLLHLSCLWHPPISTALKGGVLVSSWFQSFPRWETDSKISCEQTLLKGEGPKTSWTRELTNDGQLILVTLTNEPPSEKIPLRLIIELRQSFYCLSALNHQFTQVT